MNNPTRFTALQLAALATIQLGATADVELPARTVLSLDRRGFLVHDIEGNLRIAAASGDKVIDAANREALRMTGIVRRIVRNLVHCTLENQSEAMAERDTLDRDVDGKVEPMESRIRNEVDFHLDDFDSYSRGEFGQIDGTLADVTYALARTIARRIARKIVDEVLGADIAIVVAMYRKSVVSALERYHAENGPCFGYLAIGTKPNVEPKPESKPAPKVEPAPRDLSATASNPRPSDCMPDDPDARDVDVSITIGGVEHDGEVTLRLSDFDHEYSAWGDPDHWISGDLLEALRSLDEQRFAVACGNIEAAAIHAIANDPDPSDDNPPSRPENAPSPASTPLDPSSGMREAAAHYARTFPARKPDPKPARFAVAPASNPDDLYAAGFDGNRFDNEHEARAAIDSLRSLGGDFDVNWTVVEVNA